MSLYEKILTHLGLQRAPKEPSFLVGETMKVMDLKVRKQLRINGSDDYHVAGCMTCARNNFEWYNYRLISTSGTERWLSVEYWSDNGGELHTFVYIGVKLFETPNEPHQEQLFAVAPDRKVPYHLSEEGVGEAAVVKVEDDMDFLGRKGLEPISAAAGDSFTFWQYQRVDDPGQYLSIEIWGSEKSYSTGSEVDPNTIQIFDET